MTDRKRSILMLCCQEVGATTGSGVVASELASRLANRGNDITLVYGTNRNDLERTSVQPVAQTYYVRFNSSEQDGLPFPVVGMSNEMPYPSTTFSSLKGDRLDLYIDVWRKHIRQSIQVAKPDIIHVHHLWLLAHIAHEVAPEIPIVVSLHGTDLHRTVDAPHIRDLITLSVKGIRRFIVLNRQMIQDTCNIYGVDAKNFVILGNGFAGEIFHPFVQPRTSISFLSGVLDSIPLVTFIGKFARWKGLHHLLNAFARIDPSSGDAPLLIIAGAGSVSVEEGYQQQARHLGVGDRVRFVGHLTHNEVAQLLNTSRVFVLPSFHEPFGLVLLEAIACGCRVISANQGGPSEFVPNELRENKNALLIPGLPSVEPTPDDATSYECSLASAILTQIQKPLEIRQRQQISATVATLTWEAYIDRLLLEYDMLLNL
jgi:glycosyltransferase involved in cell wall biosynthesis